MELCVSKAMDEDTRRLFDYEITNMIRKVGLVVILCLLLILVPFAVSFQFALLKFYRMDGIGISAIGLICIQQNTKFHISVCPNSVGIECIAITMLISGLPAAPEIPILHR